MNTTSYEKIRKIIYDHSGITLREGKESLVNARVGKRLRTLNLSDLSAYLDYIENDSTGHEILNLLDVISTNVTSFFRESGHFDILKDLMSKWIDKGQRRFRFWSAACSSGEEPVTLAITLMENFSHVPGLDIRILATDISTRILEKARMGIYSNRQMLGIPGNLKQKYFRKKTSSKGNLFLLKESIKALIVYKRLNLIHTPYPMPGPLDAIFCRNVMIYFDNPTRLNLLKESERLLKDGGYLFVGHAESLTGQLCDLKNIRPSVYAKL